MVAYGKPVAPPLVSREEYLANEREAETRSEYHAGVVKAMAGASWEHNKIVFDTIGALNSQLLDQPCQGSSSDMKVRVPEFDKYFYPDIIIVCDEPTFEDGRRDSLLNPTLIIEVLSSSTQEADRGEKWQCYQTLPSLRTYVLISQDRPVIEVYRRQESFWAYTAYMDINGTVPLDEVGCELRPADVYRRITFAPPAERNGGETTSPS